MITHIRIARPVRDLERSSRLYQNGLGLTRIDGFSDHEGFDGVMLGAEGAPYHFEFTLHRHHPIPPSPTPEDLIVLYVPEKRDWEVRCAAMLNAGFREVRSLNPYWDRDGRTFEDSDGYRVVIHHSTWLPDPGTSRAPN